MTVRITARRIPSSSRALNGYSIVEILVSMAVLSVLSGILLPVFAASRACALSTACLSNLRQIHCAGMLYAGNYDVSLPPVRNLSSTFAALPPDGAEEPEFPATGALPVLLAPYARCGAVFRCPADRGIRLRNQGLLDDGSPMFERFGTSYRQVSDESYAEYTITDTMDGSRTLYAADGSGYWHPGRRAKNEPFGRIRTAVWGVNAVFMDGHARRIGFHELLATPYVEFLRDEY